MQNNIATPPITLDDLAVMVNKWFKESKADLDEFKVEVRSEFKAVRAEFREDIDSLRSDLNDFKLEVRSEFKDLKHVIGGHSRRISRVEGKLQIA